MKGLGPSLAGDGGDRPTAGIGGSLLSAADIWSAPPSPADIPGKTAGHARLQSEAPAPVETASAEARLELAAPATPHNGIDGRSSAPETRPPRKLSLALQGGGTFAAFTWGVLERLLEEPDCEFDAISGASAGAVNGALLACGWVQGGREGARRQLTRFWNRMVDEASFRSLMLLGGFSPAGSSVAFGAALRSGQFDPLDLDPLRRALGKNIDFSVLRVPLCPRLLVAATRVRDGGPQIFGNAEITADVLLASTCPPLVHCAVEIEGEPYWDGGFSANPPLLPLVQASGAADVLVVQVTPARDGYVPITGAAIDRRLDQIMANSALNSEIAALEWARRTSGCGPRIFRIAAEDEIEGLAQRSAADLGRNFIALLHRSGYAAADRWLKQAPPGIQQPGASTPQSLAKELALL